LFRFRIEDYPQLVEESFTRFAAGPGNGCGKALKKACIISGSFCEISDPVFRANRFAAGFRAADPQAGLVETMGSP
jgi:hypothetical protein